MLQLGVIYTASLKNVQIFFKNTIHTMIDPYKDKIGSTNGKILIWLPLS